MKQNLQTKIEKNVDVWLQFRQRAANALNPYGANKYPTQDKRECLAIMDKQIMELQKINVEWRAYCETPAAKKRMAYGKAFFDDFIVPARKHRRALELEIAAEETVVDQIPTLRSLLKDWWKRVRIAFVIRWYKNGYSRAIDIKRQ